MWPADQFIKDVLYGGAITLPFLLLALHMM
jgi:hypothetical protein